MIYLIAGKSCPSKVFEQWDRQFYELPKCCLIFWNGVYRYFVAGEHGQETFCNKSTSAPVRQI